MPLTVGAVDAIRARLETIPKKDETARQVTRLEAVARMKREIFTLREGGYSWKEIAEIVSREGCVVTPSTLRTELSRGGASGKGKKRMPRRREAERTPITKAEQDSPHTERTTAVDDRKAGQKTISDRSAGTFIAREDSRDI
jgi:hypothetical protein